MDFSEGSVQIMELPQVFTNIQFWHAISISLAAYKYAAAAALSLLLANLMVSMPLYKRLTRQLMPLQSTIRTTSKTQMS